MSTQPMVGIAHIMLDVKDLAASARFYADLGLLPFQEAQSLAILELRGGTHLLLMSRKGGDSRRGGGRVDLMIAGRTRQALEDYRLRLAARGLAVPEVPEGPLHGHYMLRLNDPDGNEVMVSTSHSALT